MGSHLNDARKEIADFQERVKQYLPQLEEEVKQIIISKSRNIQQIEKMLDTLLTTVGQGLGLDVFVKLLEYYKTVDSEGAAFYWKAFEEENNFE